MKCQILFSGKEIRKLSSTKLVQRVIKVKILDILEQKLFCAWLFLWQSLPNGFMLCIKFAL